MEHSYSLQVTITMTHVKDLPWLLVPLLYALPPLPPHSPFAHIFGFVGCYMVLLSIALKFGWVKKNSVL
jgi:hypothetical protein